MMDDHDWQWHVERAENYQGLGQSDVYLSRSESVPWEFAVGVESGGLHRLGTSVSAHFRAAHPSGLSFSWSMDFEDRDANGTGSYKINAKAIRQAMLRLPLPVRGEFARLLTATVEAIRKNAADHQAVVDRQERDANELTALIVEHGAPPPNSKIVS